MNDPLKTLESMLQHASAKSSRFPANSRYHGIETAVHTRADGQPVRYLKPRRVPLAEAFATLSEHRVQQGDRLDLLAARYLGDPALYWRLCDANGALRPESLTETPGKTLRITLPEGIPGNDVAE